MFRVSHLSSGDHRREKNNFLSKPGSSSPLEEEAGVMRVKPTKSSTYAPKRIERPNSLISKPSSSSPLGEEAGVMRAPYTGYPRPWMRQKEGLDRKDY